MNDLIHDELMQVIGDWANGRPLRTVALGHPVRRDPKTGEEQRHTFRQRRVQDYCMNLIIVGVEHLPIDFPEFQLMTDMAPKDLSAEERAAAESLAWKALLRGWKNALTGFSDHQYISLTREADA